MNCLTKLSQKKRMTKSYIRAFLATMISKLDSSALLLFLFRPSPHYADVKYSDCLAAIVESRSLDMC